jgi:undecaprenyl-diphosphatase
LSSDAAARRFALNLAVAFVPAAALGFLFNKAIKAHLFAPIPVACAFVVGAFFILWAERRQRSSRHDSHRHHRRHALDRCAQGGVCAGIGADSRHLALGRDDHRRHVVRLSRASRDRVLVLPRHSTALRSDGYSLWKDSTLLAAQSLPMFGIGFATAFVSAFVCVRWLIRYVAHHDFVPFAWYRIAFGAVILLTAYAGLVRWD